MPECDGFDGLELLGKDLPPAVVFVTAYDQYAFASIRGGSARLPPEAVRQCSTRPDAFAKQRIARKDLPRKLERVAIKSTGQVSFVKISEIDWIEAADYYACLHVGPSSHLLRRSMSGLEQELDPGGRIHRSAIVTLDRVRGLKLSEDSEYEVLLEKGARLRLSRRYRKQLQSRLGVRDVNCS
jgi:two-component system LytT family response regulator